MRLVLATLALGAALLLPSSLAGSSFSRADPAGDQTLLGLWAAPCADPSADLVGFSLSSDGATLTARMDLADLSAAWTCAGVPLPPGQARYDLLLARTVPVVEVVGGGLDSGENQVVFNAERDASGAWTGCTTLALLPADLSDGFTVARSGCVGTREVSGDSITWTIPANGTVLDPAGEPVAYDLRGLGFDALARAFSSPLPGAVQDALYLEDDAGASNAITV